jgi:prepilin-type N-terminal cleavage/methylation domain-containing protein
MKSWPMFRSVKRPGTQGHGFTLVEMLVAVAVLGILILILAQIFGMMNSTWLYGQGKINNFTKARAMLNMLDNDFRSAIFRPDLAAFPAAGTVEFYTQRPGVPTDANAVRNISLVKYALMTGTTNGLPTSTLQRFDMPVPWTGAGTATYLAFGNPTGFTSTAAGATSGTLTPRDTAPGVVAFAVLFVQADGSFSTTTFTPDVAASGLPNTNPTRGIGVTLAVIDDQAMRLLSPTQLSSLQSGFATTVTGSQNVKADWEHYLATGLAWNSYPKNLGTGIGIYEAYMPIP